MKLGRVLIIGVCLIGLLGCAHGGYFMAGPLGEGGADVRIFVASQRGTAPAYETPKKERVSLFGAARPRDVRFGALDISVPPTHQLGEIEWPAKTATHANPKTDFALHRHVEFQTGPAFLQALRRNPAKDQSAVFLYVHGYNTNLAESAYRLAQISVDFDVPMTPVLFAWPSAGRAQAYLYDKDSVLFARDALSDLLRQLTHDLGREVVIMAHSMGAQLTMEALRQLALEGDRTALRRIDGVTLMSPDLDPDVFAAQIERLGSDVPQPFYLMVTQRDKALRVARLLTGGRGRVGQIVTPEDFDGLPVTVLDFSNFSNAGTLDHMVQVSAPGAASLLRQVVQNEDLRQSGFGRYLKIKQTGPELEEVAR